MILRPYHSHHTLQKQVRRRTYSTVRIWKDRYQHRSIYRIAMKISSDWSNQIDLGHSQCPLFSLVNHTDYRDRYIGEDRTTRVRYVGSISLLVCTVSPDGDSRRYGQVVRTIEKEHEPIYSHRDTINSYQSHTVHQSIHLIWIDCKTLNKAYLYMHIQTKS